MWSKQELLFLLVIKIISLTDSNLFVSDHCHQQDCYTSPDNFQFLGDWNHRNNLRKTPVKADEILGPPCHTLTIVPHLKLLKVFLHHADFVF